MTEMPSQSVPQPLTPSDTKLWASLAHFGNILGLLPSLLIFLILGPRSSHVKTEAREALNFVITAIIAFVALLVVGAIVTALYLWTPSGVDVIFGLIGTLINIAEFALWALVIVFSIVGGVRVNQGGSYRYPFALRLVK